MKQDDLLPSHMHVRSIVAFACLTFAAISVAQSPEQAIATAFGDARRSSTLQLRLTGSEWTSRTTTTIWAEASYSVTYSPTGVETRQCEIVEYRDGRMARRVVATGTELFAWDPAKNEYLVSSYVGGSRRPADLSARLANGLSKVTTGVGSSLARLLADIQSPAGAIFRTWTPGFPGKWIQNQTVSDPLNPAKQYVANASQYFGYFYADNPARRTMAFRFDSDAKLQNIMLTEATQVGPQVRMLDWNVTVSPGATLPAGVFTFIPPATAKAVTGPDLG